MSKSISFDSFTSALEDFVKSHRARIVVLERVTRQNSFKSIVAVAHGCPSRERSIQLIDKAHENAVARFAEVAKALSLDAWMSVIRRFPKGAGFSTASVAITTLALIRYARRGHDSAISRDVTDTQISVAFAYTEDYLLAAFELAFLGNVLEELAGARRWISKGARLRPTESEPLALDTGLDLAESVKEYDQRHPESQLFPDEGVLVPLEWSASGLPMLVVGDAPHDYLYVPGRDVSLLCRYVPTLIDVKPVLTILRAYESAIQDLFGVEVEDIIHFVTAVAVKVLNSIPAFERIDEHAIVLAEDDGSEGYAHKLSFLFGVCQRGYLRFPRTRLLERLSEVRSPWSADRVTGVKRIERFLAAFVVRDDTINIDLMTLRPFPLVYSSESDEIYVDFVAPLDFLSSVLERSREWYSTQHGDQFTLALKQIIESRTDATVVGWKMDVVDAEGKGHEIDLLVLYGQRLYAIECKAYTKSRAFFRGDPKAVDQRTARIQQAARQAQAVAHVALDAAVCAGLDLPSDIEVEWAVCTPTQEFLRPLGKYGFLADGIPRVCTPEELLQLFSGSVE